MSPTLPPAVALPSSALPPFSGLVSPSSLDDRVSKILLPKFAQQCLSLRLRLSYFNGVRIDTKPMMQPGSKQTDGKISRQDAKPLRKELEAERQIPTVLGFFCDLLCLFAAISVSSSSWHQPVLAFPKTNFLNCSTTSVAGFFRQAKAISEIGILSWILQPVTAPLLFSTPHPATNAIPPPA